MDDAKKILKSNDFYGYLQGWIAIVTNTILSVLKLWVGITTGSIALLADAWHTLTDSLSSAILIIGIHLSSKPPDAKHPFGHGRIEFITSLLIAIVLVIVAYNFFIESIDRLIDRTKIDYGFWAIAVTILSILVKEALAQFSFAIARKTGRSSVKADGWHHRSDAISSFVILIGIFVSDYYYWIDGVLGLFIAVLIGYTAYDIIKENISNIIGEAPDNEIIKDIISIANKTSGKDLHIHDVCFHNYVVHKEMTFHMQLPKNMEVEKASDITEKIEIEITKKYNFKTTIKIEPEK